MKQPIDSPPGQRKASLTLDDVHQMLARDNRGLVYLCYYQLTGNRQMLNQAEITTYSGRLGGAAVEAKIKAKQPNPEHYRLTLCSIINLGESELGP